MVSASIDIEIYHAGDYSKMFPEDKLYEELAPDARVWKVYLSEKDASDDDMIRQAADGLDVLLVFVRTLGVMEYD